MEEQQQTQQQQKGRPAPHLPTVVPEEGQVVPPVSPEKWEELVGKSGKRMDWTLAFMTITDRFNYEVLGRCIRTPSSKIPTMGVTPAGAEIELLYSPVFAEELDDEELRWVLSHEVLHVVFHHVTHRSPNDPYEAMLDNTAADLAINSLLGCSPTGGHNGTPPLARKDILDPKTGAVKIRKGETVVLTPQGFGFRSGLSMDQYRALLLEQYGDDGGEELGDKLGGTRGGDHSGWAESEAADAQIRDWVERMQAGGSKSWGNLPMDTVAAILAAQVTEVAWERELRDLLGHESSPKKRRTMKKPNRRIGYPWCGTTKVYVDAPLFAPDTSASVDDGNLSKFLAELNRLAERRGVDFLPWSVGLTLEKPIRWSPHGTSLEFRGRGGTDPQPAIEYAGSHGYRQLIMLTDGEFGGTPVNPYPRMSIIWVITCDGVENHLPGGSHVVRMKHKGRARV